jgi:WD40 repeat protein
MRTILGNSSVNSIAFSPDNKLLASSQNKRIKLWSVTTGKQLLAFSGLVTDVGSIAFSPLGKLLATIDGRGTVKLWDVARGTQLRALTAQASSHSVTWVLGQSALVQMADP